MHQVCDSNLDLLIILCFSMNLKSLVKNISRKILTYKSRFKIRNKILIIT